MQVELHEHWIGASNATLVKLGTWLVHNGEL